MATPPSDDFRLYRLFAFRTVTTATMTVVANSSQHEPPRFLLHWEHQCDQRLLRDVVRVDHRLGQLAIFSDSGLADLLDHYPKSAMIVTTMGHTPEHPSELRRGAFEQYDGRHWIEMIRRGRLCLRLTNVCRHSQYLGEIVQRLSAEMMECQPGLHTDSHDGDLWLQSPYTIQYYDIDRIPNVSYQIRGGRRVLHYPLAEPFVLDRTLEKIAAGIHPLPLYFEPAFDQHAELVDQIPGSALGLPMHTPYRATTCGTLSVMLTTRYQSRQTHRRLQVLTANERINRWNSNQSRSTDTDGLRPLAKRMIGRLLQPANDPPKPTLAPAFRVDPDAPECVGELNTTPFETNDQVDPTTVPIFPGLSAQSASYARTGTEN